MKEASPTPQTNSHGGNHRSSRRSDPEALPVGGEGTLESPNSNNSGNAASASFTGAGGATTAQPAAAADPDSSSSKSPATTFPQVAEQGAVVGAGGDQDVPPKKTIPQRFWRNFKSALFHTKLNVLLVFVPIGIIVSQIDGMSPGLIFAMNAVAIVPLAGLLSFATESVAHKLGDSLGALLNVTFGNAVELIIFMYVLLQKCRSFACPPLVGLGCC